MLNAQDIQLILQLVGSDRLTLNGAEARGVAVLQERLRQSLQELQNPVLVPQAVEAELPDDHTVEAE